MPVTLSRMSEDPASMATIIAAVTAALGGSIPLGFLLARRMPMQRLATALHGLGATAVLAVLLWAGIPGSMPQVDDGPDFPKIGFWLLVPAVGLGLVALACRRTRRTLRGLAIGTHACVAIFGLTVFLAAVAM